MHHSEDCTGEVSSETTAAHGLHQPVSCVCGTLSVGGLHTPAKAIASPLISCQQRTHAHTHACTHTHTHTDMSFMFYTHMYCNSCMYRLLSLTELRADESKFVHSWCRHRVSDNSKRCREYEKQTLVRFLVFFDRIFILSFYLLQLLRNEGFSRRG